ncbi:phosphotransferase [Terrabacter sp. BE26]|uniref:phosphotransferase n=1 Tax=Terrabacter sp. BE26 TaxID=2898152 RepID=UPI0035BE1E03
MRTQAPVEPAWPGLPAWASDASLAERLARDWVAEHRGGVRVAGARTHSVLYRGREDLTLRIGVQLEGMGRRDALTLMVHSRSGEVSVTALPDDPFLPTLAEVLRRRTVELLLRGAGLESASGTGTPACRAEVVHHPREGACVLRLHGGGVEAYAKVYPREEDATAAAAAAGAAAAAYAVGRGQAVRRGGEGLRLPGVLTVCAPLRTIVLESVTSSGSSHVVTDRPVGPAESARALRAFHALVPAGPLTDVAASSHVDRVRREQALVATAWPDMAERVDESLCEAASVLEDFPRRGLEPVLCHGDFTPGQLVRARGGLALLDLDTVAFGDPAADLGRFLAYEAVRAARLSRPLAQTSDTREAVLAAYGAPRGGEEPARLRVRVAAYERLNLALIALRATRRLKGARAALALTLLDTTDATPGRPA